MNEHNATRKQCMCRLRMLALQRKLARERCKRKRQTFVYNPEEEIYHEPYMQSLRREFSDETLLCDSKIELPWRDIALPTTGMRIRPDLMLPVVVDAEVEVEMEALEDEEKDEEDEGVKLPWKDLLITETLPKREEADVCDSSVEIPWSDLALEKPMTIQPPPKEIPCIPDDVEIPWEEILVPRNIIIESDKWKTHPSSKRSPHIREEPTPEMEQVRPVYTGCNVKLCCKPCCGPCCGKSRTANTPNKSSYWTATT